MVGYVTLILTLYVGAFALSLVRNVNICWSYPISAVSFFLLEYLLMLTLNSAKLSILVLILFITITSTILIIWKHNDLIEHIKHNCCLNTIIFIIIAALCLVIAIIHGSDPYLWDEFAHWGQMSKEIFRLDYFYITEQTTLTFHNDYPPMPALITSISSIISGDFNLTYGYALMFFICFIFLIPLINTITNRVVINIPCVIFISLLFILVSDDAQPSIFLSIYPDTLLAIASGFTIYNAWKCKINFISTISLSFYLSFIILIKQSALIFVFVAFCIYLIRLVILKKLKNIAYLILLLFITLSVFFSWKCTYDNSWAQQNISSQFSVIPQNLEISISEINILTCLYYLRSILFTNLIGWSFLPFSYILWVIVTIVVCIFFFKNNKYKNRIVLCTSLFIYTIYMFFMLYSYLFLFHGEESTNLACFRRYMNTVIAVVIIYILYSLEKINCSLRIKKLSIATFAIILLFSIICWPNFKFYKHYKINTSWPKSTAKFLDDQLNNHDKVFVINKGMSSLDIIMLAYYTNHSIISREIESGIYVDNAWKYDNDKMLNFIKSCNYIYIDTIDEDFFNTYKNILEISTLSQKTLYRVNVVQDKVYLQ